MTGLNRLPSFLRRWVPIVTASAMIGFGMGAAGQPSIWVETGRDIDYVLDMAAVRYVKAADPHRKALLGVYWCGTPVHMVGDFSVPERELVQRAERLLAFASARSGKQSLGADTSKCRTPNCGGTLKSEEIEFIYRMDGQD